MFAAVRIIGRLALPLVMGVVLAISAGTAQAGDAAARHIIGFSPDGAYFAFEQMERSTPAPRTLAGRR
ncbi:hypothetical protein [Mesorhizobium sp.]|uniref:hypothetical protein n=1 Tax=Mesorhizobium sp. TaxID=1871066 RepID=UPI0025BD2036|nr:hypothetical protein [Mesorhizobium sp.]